MNDALFLGGDCHFRKRKDNSEKGHWLNALRLNALVHIKYFSAYQIQLVSIVEAK